MPLITQEHLAAALLDLVDAPLRGEDEDRLLHRLARNAQLLPGVDAAGCSLTGPDASSPAVPGNSLATSGSCGPIAVRMVRATRPGASFMGTRLQPEPATAQRTSTNARQGSGNRLRLSRHTAGHPGLDQSQRVQPALRMPTT